MPESKRQKIVSAVVARMEGISVADGYETDLGETVRDWKVNYQEDELPALSVCDTVADIDFVNGNIDAPSQQHRLPVLLRVFCKSDTPAEELRKMVSDVIKAVGGDPGWTVDGKRLAMFTRVTKAGIIVPNESFEIAGAAVEIEITYLAGRFEF
jgi:hypothetical protein